MSGKDYSPNEASDCYSNSEASAWASGASKGYSDGWQSASQHYEEKIAEMQAELDKARELLTNALPDLRYTADISETVEKLVAEIDAFLAKDK